MNSGDRPPHLSLDLPPDELVARMEQMRSWLQKQNELPPAIAPPVDRFSRIEQQLMKNNYFGAGEVMMPQTYIGSPKNSSSVPLEELSRVSISEMMLRKVHKGKFLLCRSVAPMIRVVGSQTVVEDPDGAITDLAIYNFPTTGPGSSSESINKLFPIGTIMAVREPLLKLGTQGGDPLIRVDSISDIVFLDQNDSVCFGIKWSFPLNSSPSPASAEKLKIVGNNHFARGEWLLAVFAYSKGLRLDKDAYLLRSNRAETYLRLSYYSAALLDAQAVLSNDVVDSKSRWKAQCRAGKALYFQGEYAAARSMFQEAMMFPEDEDSKTWIKRIDKREEESNLGRYDWRNIYTESLKSPHIQHIADFRGPIEVKPLTGRGGGRGVVATADIGVGQLLVVEKPFGSMFPSDLPSGERLGSFNLITKTVDSTCHTVLISKVMERLWGNPECHSAVFNLFAGPEHPTPSSPKTPSFPDSGIQFPFRSAVDIDASHLEAVVSYNAFSPQPLVALETKKMEKTKSLETPSALYLFSSLFNHSCLPNAQWTCFGNIMVIRAIKPISTGEEIYISYSQGPGSIEERQKVLQKHFLSGCSCSLCTDDRADGAANCQRREDLGGKLYEVSSIAESRRLLRQMESTYKSTRSDLRPEMFPAKHRLAEVIRAELKSSYSRLPKSTLQSRVKEAVAFDIDALRNAGVTIEDQMPAANQLVPDLDIVMLISDYLAIAVNFLNLDDQVRAKGWVKAAELAHKTGLGGDKTLFKLLFGKVVDGMGIREFVYSVI
ncbi:SET domain-containing protein [Dendrothele bispora CBS 962.96]|uniref:SET domain-containing protein n=1 Tax=Dendrothele bispora (strain CBS 962.96) TaxID=1314807 RepID=A0A4S8MJU9_DENBC|nr:SET domain-containing protein [Dendrothele bispora CBS 962.96]